eukprot:scaffold104956_cov28-Tisochrysis_lutea.AAC.6
MQPSACCSPISSNARATSKFVSPVTSAPVSMSACNGGDQLATRARSDKTDQSSPNLVGSTTAGEVSTCSIRASSPGENAHLPSSSGSRLFGVPEKPMRRPNMASPPISCPEAQSLRFWKCMVWRKTPRGSSFGESLTCVQHVGVASVRCGPCPLPPPPAMGGIRISTHQVVPDDFWLPSDGHTSISDIPPAPSTGETGRHHPLLPPARGVPVHSAKRGSTGVAGAEGADAGPTFVMHGDGGIGRPLLRAPPLDKSLAPRTRAPAPSTHFAYVSYAGRLW